MITEENFRNPPKEYRIPQYELGKPLDESALDAIDSFGIGGIVMSVNYLNYLKNDESWSHFLSDSKRAKERGFQVWLYDEQGYPSGMAGGQVVVDNPEYEALGLFCLSRTYSGPETFKIALPEKADRFIYAAKYPLTEGKVSYDAGIPVEFKNGCVDFSGDGKEYLFCAFGVERLRETTQAATTVKQFGTTGLFPSLLSSAAVKKFINLTHQAYADRLEDFDKIIDAVYTGEPNLMTLHFCGERQPYQSYVPFDFCLFEKFREMHGYDVTGLLGALFAGEPDEYPRVRLHYYQTVGEVMRLAFSEQVSYWCSHHAVAMTGHLLLEEDIIYQIPTYGDFWKVMSHFDIPGVDMPIIPSSYDRSGDLLGLRYATSIARLSGKQSQCLMDPIIGGHKAVDTMPLLDLFIDNLNFLCYAGISRVTTYGIYQKYGKDVYNRYNEYAGRLCMLLRDALDLSEVAIYYPVESFQALYRPDSLLFWQSKSVTESSYLQKSQTDITEAMKNNSIDCNFLNAQAIEDAEIIGNSLNIADHEYKVVVMPSVDIMPVKTLEKLVLFKKCGGKVIFTGNYPRMGLYESEDEKVASLAGGFDFMPADKIADSIMPILTSKIITDADTGKVYLSSYITNGKRMFFIADHAGEEQKIKVDIPDADSVKIYDASTGGISVSPLPAEIHLGKDCGKIILEI